MSHKKIIINKRDKYRVLLTDVLPYDVPIIFSNKVFYDYLKNNNSSSVRIKNLINALVNNTTYGKGQIIPYKYDITKGQTGTRELFLLHPYSQHRIVDFYSQYSDVVTYYTTLSRISIRAPKAIASSFYVHNFDENKDKFKTDSVQIDETELYSKYVTSFFSYSGYEKIYKFYGSEEMQQHEKKFSNLLIADVSNCFGSIYTHSITWAIKDKQFAKDNLRSSNNFADRLDSLFQMMNHNETNGIPIGPEVSRIFSEIIFQKIDLNLIQSISNKFQLEFGQDYTIRRYVDDYFIYANNDKNLNDILETLKFELRYFRFHLNEKKLIKSSRPFFTDRSKATMEIENLIDDLFKDLFVRDSLALNLNVPLLIKKRKFVHKYIDRVKLVCHGNNIDYDGISNFIIGMVFRRVEQIYKLNLSKREIDPFLIHEDNFTRNTLALIDFVFFLYSASPSVASSYNLAKVLVIVQRFFRKVFPKECEAIEQSIYDQIVFFLKSHHSKVGNNKFNKILLESINLILILGDLGTARLLPEVFLREIFSFRPDHEQPLRYFESISMLYYMGKHDIYNSMRDEMVSKISEKFLINNFNINCSETIHMLFDFISCPFLEKNFRIELSKKLLSSFVLSADIGEATGLVNDFEKTGWFISWKDVDLLNILERKVLQNPYE